MNEIWKYIEGYQGKYIVSNKGTVKSVSRDIQHGNHVYHRREYILKPYSINGYRLVTLRTDNKSKHYQIHRLVAEAFIPNPDNKPMVNHIDGNPSNNCLENLEWCTAKENAEHAIRTGLYSIENCREAGMTHAKSVLCVETNKVYPSQGLHRYKMMK